MEKINLEDYTYHLPSERIAQNPLEKRDSSKLLVYKKGTISHHHFTEITDFLNEDYTLYFNNTKVIPARLLFEKKATQKGQNGKGATIEIFLLHPLLPTADVSEAMLSTGKCSWKCVVGNLKRWKEGLILERELEINNQTILIEAKIADRKELLIELEWKSITSNNADVEENNQNTQIPFVDIVEKLGVMPLPPYIKRKAEQKDSSTYQTIYSKAAGAVAAPTAGLHFTESVLQNLAHKNIKTNELTLHVGAGTFQPVKKENAGDVATHTMHCEQIVITKENIKSIIDSEKVASVGTTSMRTLESLYWYGTKILLKEETSFFIEKLEPYSYDSEIKLPSKKESFEAILKYMNDSNQYKLTGETEIFILPSYNFRVCDALITNFHMPETTLILLVAAFIGEDWRKIYQTALDNDYRFLSYGDSSLLFL